MWDSELNLGKNIHCKAVYLARHKMCETCDLLPKMYNKMQNRRIRINLGRGLLFLVFISTL